MIGHLRTKSPSEAKWTAATFTDVVEVSRGERIESISFAAIRMRDGVDVTADMAAAPIGVDPATPTKLWQLVQGGDDGEAYALTFSIVTNFGAHHHFERTFRVRRVF